MSQLPMDPLSPEQQRKWMEQLYLRMGKQAQSYYKHRRMGKSTSVPVELARELMESVDYTLSLAGGPQSDRDLEETFLRGQRILSVRLGKAKAMLEQVIATAPDWQTECRRKAIYCLRKYLDRYDFRHLAHKGPEELYYPILIAYPEGVRGIDLCLFYLNILWVENQIMAGVSEDAQESLWDRLPVAALNQCENLLINGMGKALLGAGLASLTFRPEEYIRLMAKLMVSTEEELRLAAERLCQMLQLKSEYACGYVQAVIPLLMPWLGDGAAGKEIEGFFL